MRFPFPRKPENDNDPVSDASREPLPAPTPVTISGCDSFKEKSTIYTGSERKRGGKNKLKFNLYQAYRHILICQVSIPSHHIGEA